MTTLGAGLNKTGTGLTGGLGGGAGLNLSGGLNKTGTGTSALGGLGKPGTSLLGGAKPQMEEVPQELKNKTVKDVLDSFEAQLEEQSHQFLQQARQISRWDRSIYECLALMQHLEQSIKTIEGAQKELSQAATSLLGKQESFIKDLTDKKDNQQHVTSDQRQTLYKLAHELGEQFLEMEGQLKEIVEQTEGKAQTEASSDVDTIIQIVNCHLDSMRWLDHMNTNIDEKLDELQKKLQDVQ